MRYTITAPVPDFSGEVAGVAFARGTATVDTDSAGSAAALAYFGRKGYSVAPVEESKPAEPVAADEQTPEPEAKAAPKRGRRTATKEEESDQ